MTAVQHILPIATKKLQNLTENPKREAVLLIAHVLKKSYEDIYFRQEQELTKEEEDQFTNLLNRRLCHEPLSKIREQREFWSLPFKVTKDTLDPRPDSETLIEAVLDTFPDKTQPLEVLDLGTGSGCLLLSLLYEYPRASGVGVDKMEAACQIAKENAKSLTFDNRASFVVGNWGDPLNKTFDIIISNPPYIGTNEDLPLAVSKYDPDSALFAGIDGLEDFKVLAHQLPNLTKSTTKIFLEIGIGQETEIERIFAPASKVKFYKDLQGLCRCAVFCMNTMPVNEA